MKIKYLAHYNTPENRENRAVFPAAVTKIDYVASAMAEAGYPVEIISAANAAGRAPSPGGCRQLTDRIRLVLLPGMGRGGWLKNKLSTLVFHIRLFLYLLGDLKREDTLVVYHSLALMPLVRVLKKLRRFRLVLEVEEIYGDVTEDAATSAREMAYFQLADGYLCITELLNRKINPGGKPCVLAHGTYRAEEVRGGCPPDWDPNRIHCLYAGTFDPKKGGALAAVNAAAYLPAGYHLHILGFGSPSQVQHIRALAGQITARGNCTVTYDGCMSGEAYTRFLQACDIGLSTQNPDGAFNATSFPSKILSYMANGLRVVSVRIPAVETSAVGDMVSFCDGQTPEQIARAILAVDLQDGCDSRSRLRMLHGEFMARLPELLGQ